MDKMRKIGSIASSSILSKSKFFNTKDMITTTSPALNIALSGSIYGGITPGLTFLAGPSRTFKTCMGLKMVSAYLDKYPESMCIFYDSEFGITEDYLKQMGVDTDRVLHVPIEDIEQFKFDIMQKLKEVVRGDKIIIFVDSIGNLASKKEVEDALKENAAADMTRSKQMKSCFRMITPHLTTKDIPMIAVNHTYSTMELYSKQVMSGGTGPMYSANTVFIISRAQEKDKDNELEGFTFTINIEKSRFVKEKSKIPLTVRFEDGIDRYSGILDIALEGGFITQPTKQTYQLTSDQKLPPVKKKNVEPLLDIILKDDGFAKYIENKYKMTGVLQTSTKKEEDDDE
jgi:RecA/RadA recombinase